MKAILQEESKFILRFDRGEEVLTEIAKFMEEKKISACSFTGLGACAGMEMAFYNDHVKEYRKKPFYDELEIINLNGNGALMDGKPILHAHGIFGKNDFTTIGGHVFSLTVAVTCEIFLTVVKGEIKRALDADSKLNLMV